METKHIVVAASVVVLVFSVVVHEVAHGYAALKLGDDTARREGRLTLNPVPHIDLFFTIILPVMLALASLPVFGGAKPVPVNPFAFFRGISPRKGMMVVAAAGPLSNFCLAALGLLLFHATKTLGVMEMTLLFYLLIKINAFLMVFNLVPVPPLDGSKVLMGVLGREQAALFARLEPWGMLLVFALIFLRVLDPVFGGVDRLLNVLLGL